MKKTHPLKRWRQEQGLTLAQMANQLAISPSFVSMIEKGARGPSLQTALVIASETGISIEDLARAVGQ